MARIIRKAAPPMSGPDVARLQKALVSNPFAEALGQGAGFSPGPTDGIAGPQTLAACKRAKYALGYRTPDETGGALLLAYLQRRQPLTTLMRKRRLARIDAYQQEQGVRPTVVVHKWAWRYPLIPRIGKPRHLIFHHAAAPQTTAEAIHRSHLARGFSGIGYMRFIAKDGVIHTGRPLWAIGAHTQGYNSSIGICVEGSYDVETDMPAAQLASVRWQRERFHERWPQITDKRHCDLNATACPGAHFPWEKVAE